MKKLFSKSAYRNLKTKLFPYPKLADEFYDTLYLTANGATLFVPENLYVVDHVMRNLPTGDPIMEIGSFTGMSTSMLLHFLRKHGKKNVVINADRWDFEEKEKKYYERVLKISADEMKKYVRDSFIRNITFFNRDHLPFTIELFSDDFFMAWQDKAIVQDVFNRQVTLGGAISFGYLDGNHQYEFAKRDFENLHQWLVPGGFIFLDDSAAHIDTGMHRVAKEIANRRDYSVVMKNPNYLFRKSGR